MAKASLPLIDAIRKSAHVLEQSNEYQWGHMGSCNCGFLEQQVTKLRKDEIHSRAMERYGDWSEQLNDYCPASGLPLDEVISEMIAFGFDAQDLKHLEKLSDSKILRSFPLDKRDLKYNIKKDVLAYMRAWANLLEQELLDNIELPVPEETVKVEA